MEAPSRTFMPMPARTIGQLTLLFSKPYREGIVLGWLLDSSGAGLHAFVLLNPYTGLVFTHEQEQETYTIKIKTK